MNTSNNIFASEKLVAALKNGTQKLYDATPLEISNPDLTFVDNGEKRLYTLNENEAMYSDMNFVFVNSKGEISAEDGYPIDTITFETKTL